VTDPFTDPGDPSEPRSDFLKPGDLVNLPCLFRVTGEGHWPAKPAYTDDTGKQRKAQGPQYYVTCDVVVLGAAGIEAHDSDVRINWSRVVPAQISMANLGQWVPARPKKQDDNSIILMGFDAKGKATAAALLPEVEALFSEPVPAVPDAAAPPAYAPGEEPF
jgi:hypothetical protein